MTVLDSLKADKLRAEIAKINVDRECSELIRSQMQRTERVESASASLHQRYMFYKPVTDLSVSEAISELGHWSRMSPGMPLEVTFTSPGGGVIAGLAFFDFLRQLRGAGHVLTTVAIGYAASMGGILLQAGDVRIMTKNAYMLIHEVSTVAGGKMSDLEDDIAFTRRLQDRLVAILAERSSLSEAQIRRRWKKKDWWLDADEAFELGLVDEVR